MATSNIYYSAEFVVSFEKLKKGVVESQAALAKLEGELKKYGSKTGREVFGEIGKEADKAKKKIDGLGKTVQKANAENTKSSESFFSAFKKGWKDSTDVAGGQAVKLGKLMGQIVSPMHLAITAATAAFAFIASKAKEAYNNWKEHNARVKEAKDLYVLLNSEVVGMTSREREIYEIEKKITEERARSAAQAHRVRAGISEQAYAEETARRIAVEQQKARDAQALKYSKEADAARVKALDVYKEAMAVAEKAETDQLGLLGKKRDAENAFITTLISEQAKLDTRNSLELEAFNTMEAQINEHRELAGQLNAEITAIQSANDEKTKEKTLQEKLDDARAAAGERYLETIAKINDEQEKEILSEQEADDARNGAMVAWKDALQGIVDEYDLLDEENALIGESTVALLNEIRAIVGETEKQKRLEKETQELAEASRKLAEDTADINEQITKQEIDQLRAEAEIADTEEEKNRLLDEALQMEIDLLRAQREREKIQYKATKEYQTAMKENRILVEAWETAFDKATDGMIADLKKVEKASKTAMGFSTEQTDAQKWADELASYIDQGVGYFESAASSVLSITQGMAEDQIAAIENLLEQQQELIDAQYEATMERLEEERQAALEAAGFVAAITEEGLEASMEAAAGSGDEAVIYREKRRQQELAINKKYDKQEADAEKKKNDDLKAAEEKAAREIADIEYRQAMADWSIKLAMAPAQIAVAVLEGFAQTGPFAGLAGAAIMGVIGALQLAAIIAAMPKKPALAGGGVIGLPQTYTGGYADGGIVMANTPRGVDAVDTVLANREMVLNDAQQTALFNAIAAGQMGGGVQTVTVQLIVDGEVWAERMVDLINNGTTSPINARMIQ